ncbi:MAG: hypothetical protein H7A25_02285 [Leptospiraceae bacterium]|nr:hypothetical protein [Leptospiraceae bacterium]MCP5498705.1 hypothetical protein [Leptospiraceae bacterium]
MKILIKTFSLVVLSLYFIFPLFAEKPVDTPLPTGSTNWSIQMILGKGGAKTKLRSDNSTFFSFLSGSFSNEEVRGESYHYRFYGEFLPSYVGYIFGISGDTYKFKPKVNPVSQFLPILLLSNSPGSSTYSSLGAYLFPLVLMSAGSQSNEAFGASVPFIDHALSLHFRPKKTLDPYLNLGIGFGSCGVDCIGGKAFARLGLRINFSSVHLFLEGEKQHVVLKRGREESEPIDDQILQLGFGIYL